MADRIVRVDWLDHTDAGGGDGGPWASAEEVVKKKLARNVSVGKLLRVTRDAYYVAGTWADDDDDTVGNVMVVARKCVTRVRVLVERAKGRGRKKK